MADIIATDWADALSEVDGGANGDRVLLPNGSYALGSSVVNITKTNDANIVTLMAQNRGGAILTGRGIDVNDPKIILEGFNMQFSSASSGINMIEINGADCAMKGNVFVFGNPGTGIQQKWIRAQADNFTFHYNDMHGKRCIDDMFLFDDGTNPISGAVIAYNDFYDFVQLPGDTRSEVIRIGNSAMPMVDFDTEIHHNRIWNCDADTEVLSIKASGCNVHDNFLKDTTGAIVLRQAHNCNVENNLLINTGLRFYGHGHTIRYNQVIDNSFGGVSRTCYIGPADVEEYLDAGAAAASPGEVIPANANYARTKDNYIEYNIFNNSDVTSTTYMLLGGGDSDTGSLPPINNFFRYNIIYGSDGTFTHQRSNISALWTANTCTGNIFHPTGSAVIGDFPVAGYTDTDLGLQRRPDGTYRLMHMLTDADVGPEAYHYT